MDFSTVGNVGRVTEGFSFSQIGKKASVGIVTALFMQCISSVSSLSLGQPVNFDFDTQGHYLESDFKKDWSMNPTSSSGQAERLMIVPNPDDSNHNALQVKYLANQVGGNSAMTFTAPLGDKYEHLFLEYAVRFASNFTWVKGGKLPGLTSSPDSPTGCIEDGTFDGFSDRFMWRENGQLKEYIYNPDKVEDCGDYYVASPAFYFKVGTWYNLKQEVILGTPGEHDGSIFGYVNDDLIFTISNIMLREGEDIFIDEIKMDTFFGGSSSDWAPTEDQYAYFANFSISTPSESLPLPATHLRGARGDPRS